MIKNSKLKVGIIGSGISGLGAAYYLKKHGIDSVVIEASMNPGGRIRL